MPQRLRVFISSPADVPGERLRADLIIDKLSQDYSRFFAIRSYRWEHEAMLATAHFQDAIEPPSAFDIVVLILWSRLGTPLPERTGEREYRGIDGRAPVTGTEWEYEEALKVAKVRKAPDLLAFRNVSPAPIDPRNRDSQSESMAQLNALNDFWSRHFADRGVFLAAYDEYRTIEEFAQRLEESLRRLIERRIKESSAGEPQAEPVWLGDPFRGLESYEFEHAPIYFGREAAVTKAIEQLAANARSGHAFLLVSGASGSGKSSLAKAGGVSRLMKPQRISGAGFLRRVSLRPGAEGANVILGLAKALVAGGGPDIGLPELISGGQDAEQLAAHLRSAAADPGYLFANALGRLTEAERKSGRLLAFEDAKLVLVVDQLEELYTISGITPDDRRLFIRLLGGLARSGAVWVIATIRSDFWHRAAETPELVALAEGQGRIDLLAPSPSELAEMIRKPAQAAGLAFEPHPASGLALDAVLAEHAVAAPGALPLLSFTLDELYKAAEARGDRVLTHASYEALGGLEGAIARRADETLAGLPAPAQATLPQILRALTTVAGAGNEAPVARAAPLASFPEGSPARALVDAFITARLLVAGSDRAAGTVRLAHEALISRWRRARDQLAEDRRDLGTRTLIERQLARWTEARGTPRYLLLLRNPDLANAVDLARRWGDELDPASRDFIRRSARRARLTQTLTAAAAVLFAVAAGVAVYARSEAVSQRALAEKAAKDANDQRNRALLNASRRLGELAEKALANERPTVAALLALEGLPGPQPDEQRPYLATLESILYRAGAELRELPSLGNSVESSDRSRFAAIDDKGNAAIYDAETGDIVFPLAGHTARVTDIAFFKNFVATASADNTARLWDAATGRQLLVLQHDAPVVKVSLLGDKFLMTACQDGSANLWSIPDGKRQASVKAPSGTITSLYPNQDMHRAISIGDDKTARLWDTTTGHQLAAIETPPATAGDPSFSPRIYGYLSNSGRLALVQRESAPDVSDAVIVNAVNGQQVAQVDKADGFIGEGEYVYAGKYGAMPHFKLWDPETNTVLIDRDAKVSWGGTKTFALWSKQGPTVEIWDRATLKPVITVSASANLTDAYLLPKVERLFTASSDGTMAFWNTENGQLVRQVTGVGTDASVRGSFLDDRRLVASVHYDNASVWDDDVSLWDTVKGVQLQTLEMDGRWDVLWQGDANKLTGSVGGAFRVWDLETGEAYPEPDLKEDHADKFKIESPIYSDDGRRGAVVIAPGTIRIWNVTTGKKVEDIRTPTDGVSLTLSPDGGKLLLKGKDGAIRAWNADSGALLGAVDDTGEIPRFSPHGNLLTIRQHDASFLSVLRTRIWRLDGASPMTSLRLGPGPARQIRFMGASSENGLLVRRSSQALVPPPFPFRVQIYDLGSGTKLQEIAGPDRKITDGGLSDDGRHVATLTGDGLAHIWDVATGQSLATAPAEHGGFFAGDWLQTKAEDSHLEIWNLATARLQEKLQGITESVNGGVFSNDGRYLATWSHDGGARLWEAASGRQIAFYPDADRVRFNRSGDRAFITFLKMDAADFVETASGRLIKEYPGWQSYGFSPDGAAAVVLDEAGGHVIDAATGATRAGLAIAGNQAGFQICDDAKLILSVADKGNTVRLWDGQAGKELALPQQGGKPADFYLLGPDCRFIVLEHDNAAFRFDFATESAVPLQAHRDSIVLTKISDSGRLLLTVSKNGDVGLSDLAKGGPGLLLEGAGEALKLITLSTDEREVVTKSDKDIIRIWDAETGKLIRTLNFDETEDPSFGVRTPDGKLLVLINQKFVAGTNIVQQLDEAGAARAELRLRNRVVNFGLNDDNSLMLAQTADDGVELWNIARQKRVAQMPGGSGSAAFSFSADGRRMAEVNESYSGWSFSLWNSDGQSRIATQKFSGEVDRAVSGFTPDSRHFWVFIGRGSSPGKMYVFDSDTGASERMADQSTYVAVDGKGQRFLDFPEKSGDGRVWDIASGRQIATIPSLDEGSKPRFSPDGALIATVKEKDIDLWDASTGALRSILPGQASSITTMAFSRDGQYLASGSYDGAVRVWSVTDARPRYTFSAKALGTAKPAGDVRQLVFSDDGRRLAVRTDDLISLWNMATGEEVAQSAVTGSNPLSLSPDGRLLLRAGDDTVSPLVYRVFSQVSDIVAAARPAMPRCLTRAERDADFLDPEPPAWCIEMNKWPYQSRDWKEWLERRRLQQVVPPTPDTTEWPTWIAAQRDKIQTANGQDR